MIDNKILKRLSTDELIRYMDYKKNIILPLNTEYMFSKDIYIHDHQKFINFLKNKYIRSDSFEIIY